MITYNIYDGVDGVIASMFGVSLILFGSFFLLNLFTAVIM